MKIKDFILGVIATVVFAVIMSCCLYHCTSAEYWYAGEHTEWCNGSNDCGCYEKLVKMDRAGK